MGETIKKQRKQSNVKNLRLTLKIYCDIIMLNMLYWFFIFIKNNNNNKK